MSNVKQNIENENKPLNLKYVSEAIGSDWKSWKPGDVVCISSQTGTGKTTFITGISTIAGLIDTMEHYERLIYLCNRLALKRQIKLDLLKKYDMTIPLLIDEKENLVLDEKGNEQIDYDKLDKLTVIENITVSSYHAIAKGVKNRIYLTDSNNYNLDNYKYIVCDEAHFVLTDSSYMNKTNLVFSEIIKGVYLKSILIYISATLEELLPEIEEAFDKNITKNIWGMEKNQLHKFSTGIDYSYLNVKYFKNENDILKLIANEKTSDKWLIFVTSEKRGQKIRDQLNDYDIKSVFVKSGINNEETKNIINLQKFNCKVLISTKCLDNGINITDNEVRNLVVCAYDKTTFIQEIGRLRVNIRNPRKISLFIKTMDKKIFKCRVEKIYSDKIKAVELFKSNLELFKYQYNMDVNDIYPELFYLDKNNQWQLNTTGHKRLLKDYDFASQMIESFKVDKFAFIKEQLKWLGKESDFNISNFIEDVASDSDIDELSIFLDSCYSNKEYLSKDDFRTEIISIINKSTSLTSILNKIDGKHKNREKGIKIFNEFIEKCELPYILTSKPKMKDYIRYTAWIVGKDDV